MNTLTGPQIQRMIDDLRRVIASCEPLTSKAKVPQLDTDILRSQLQGIYEQLFFAQQADEKLTGEKTSLPASELLAGAPVAEAVPQAVAAPVVQPTITPIEPAASVPVGKVTGEKTSLPASEPVAAAPDPAPVAEVVPPAAAPVVQPIIIPIEPAAPAPAEKVTGEKTSLPVPEPVAAAPKPVPVAEPIAKPVPAPVSQPKAESAKPAPAPQFHAPAPTTRFQQKPITNISAAIGLNDRFLYIRTLFGGNAAELADTVAKLNAMQSFDEAMQYIGSHYQWDMEDAVTVQFLELVNRRFI